MAKYTLPPIKKQKTKDTLCAYPDDPFYRRVSLPVNAAIIGECEVGESCEFKVKGKVVSMSQNTDQERSRCDVTIELSTVECC